MDHTTVPLQCQAGGVSVWHPENLDVDALVECYGQRVAEGVLWLGSCIYTQLADDARCRDTDRVPLQAKHLHAILGRHHVDAVRNAALEAAYVVRDRSYRVGHRSQEYSVLPPFDRARLVRRGICNPALRLAVRRWREARHRDTWERIERNETAVDPEVCKHLARNLERVRIDLQGDKAAHPAHQVAVERIQEADLWFKVDDFGRIHTNLTSLPKVLRCGLTVDGRHLENVDISESQPLFIGITIARNFGRATKKGFRATTQQERQPDQPTAARSLHMFDNTMFDKRPPFGWVADRDHLPNGARSYLELCEARGLYQTVADRLGKTRDEAKKQTLAVFFDKPWHHNAVSGVLDELFPTVMDAMREIKRSDYRRLAHLAQRIESAFMFGRVAPRIMALRPDLFISTIHDSILTTAGEGQLVRQVMLDEFEKLGLAPQVKVEECRENFSTTLDGTSDTW